jgi:hypothetical protein
VTAARLAAGDWVVLAHPHDGPLGFLGKITDGEWDPSDDALLRARVETSTRALWLAAGDLERVAPAEEADLVEAALEACDVAEERAARLRADVAALRSGALEFVRSPGLLDRLWAALPPEREQRTGGLAAFFDEGRRHLRALRLERIAPELEPLPVGGPRQVTTPEEAVERILEGLTLDELVQARNQLLGEGHLAEPLRADLLLGLRTAQPSIGSLCAAIPEATLSRLLPALGYPTLKPGKSLTLAERLTWSLTKAERRAARERRAPEPEPEPEPKTADELEAERITARAWDGVQRTPGTDLAVGDWVAGFDPGGRGSRVRGMQRIVEGREDGWSDGLAEVRLEAPRGATRWVLAEQVIRLEPVDEADILERALAGKLLATAAADELAIRLWRFRLGEVGPGRSPGFLDRLRALLDAVGTDREGLADLLEGGIASLERARRLRSRPDGRPPAEAAISPPLPVAEPPHEEGQPLPTPRSLLEAIDRVLRIRGTRGIKDICRRLELPHLAHKTADATAHALHNHGVTLHPLLRALPVTHLRLAPDALGLPDVTGDTEQELVEALVAELEPLLARGRQR